MTDLTAARQKAEQLAYSLGIALYLRPDGTIGQSPPGELIAPPPSAVPTMHGHTVRAEASAAP